MAKSRILAVLIIGFSFGFLNSVCAQGIGSAFKEQKPQTSDMNRLWQQGTSDLRANIQKIIKEKEEYRLNAESFRTQVAQLESQIVNLEDNIEKTKKELEDLQSEYDSLQKQGGKISTEKESLAKENSSLKNKITSLESTIKELKQKREPLAKGCESEVNQLRKTENLLKESEKENFDLNQKNSELNIIIKDNQSQIAELEKDLKRGKEQSDSLYAQLDSAGKNVASVGEDQDKRISDLESRLFNLQFANEELKTALKRNELEKSNLLQNPDQLQSTVIQLNEEIAKLQQENVALKNDISGLNNMINDSNNQLVSLNREKAILESILQLHPKQPAAAYLPGYEEGAKLETLAYEYALKGDNSSAIKKYEEAIGLDPQNKNLYYNLGCIYTKIEEFQKAIEQFEQVLKLDPNDKQTHFNLSKIYEYLGNSAKSKSHYFTYLNLK